MSKLQMRRLRRRETTQTALIFAPFGTVNLTDPFLTSCPNSSAVRLRLFAFLPRLRLLTLKVFAHEGDGYLPFSRFSGAALRPDRDLEFFGLSGQTSAMAESFDCQAPLLSL